MKIVLRHLLGGLFVYVGSIFAIGLICFCVYALFSSNKPVLYHSDYFACDCTDWSSEVDGYTVFNPFRDRIPEQSADSFLSSLSNGRNLINATNEMIAYKDIRKRYFQIAWKLRYRKDEPHRTLLYYNFERFGIYPTHGMSGEGYIELVEIDNEWKANWIEVVF